VLSNWSRYPGPSEIDSFQATLKRAIALEKRPRRRASRGLTERVDTWMTDRLAWARFYWET